jgi:hypothetical protein
MKNKDKYNLAHLHIVERAEETILGSNITYVEIKYDGKIVKEYAYTNAAGIKKFLEWLEEEYVPNILTDKEKAYLSAVIKPFREEVETIEKTSFSGYEQLQISDGDTIMAFPCFEKGTMYKGMEKDRDYTLKELGL